MSFNHHIELIIANTVKIIVTNFCYYRYPKKYTYELKNIFDNKILQIFKRYHEDDLLYNGKHVKYYLNGIIN